ncbi:MAG TPA: outer membrane beta-barrel protein, partial [Alphaproteobacteria bacterium]
MNRTAAPLAIALALACVPASAQTRQDQLAQQQTPTAVPTQTPGEVERGETVMSRARPDYDPIGLRLGGFVLYPELWLQESYDSNIFATPT